MKVCVPLAADGHVDPRRERANCVASAELADGGIRDWQLTVAWGNAPRPGNRGHPSRPGGTAPAG
jgi:hypothetical protein